MIHVIALISAPPGQRNKVLDAFNAVAPLVRAEDGCIEYVATVAARGMPPLKGQIGPDTVVAVEKWANLQALGAHSATPHLKAFMAHITDLGATVTIHVLEPAAMA